MEGLADDALEMARPGDRWFDYCLWEYDPVAPVAGKLRSVNLLRHSFRLAGVEAEMAPILTAIRNAFGRERTVWGVKRVGDRLSWEFYFYDYARLQRERSITRLLDILQPYVTTNLAYNETRPYFMFSIDLDAELARQSRTLDEIDVYVGNVGSSVSSGICYALTVAGLELDNFYFFFDAASEMTDIKDKIGCSAHLDLDRLDFDDILWPEMTRCKTIVVANKKHNEGIYFSRVRIGQLVHFLEKTGHPEDLVGFVRANRDRLDHMLYDVGMDYVSEDGRIRILKTSYYGTF